jgi:hypothetical protein
MIINMVHGCDAFDLHAFKDDKTGDQDQKPSEVIGSGKKTVSELQIDARNTLCLLGNRRRSKQCWMDEIRAIASRAGIKDAALGRRPSRPTRPAP